MPQKVSCTKKLSFVPISLYHFQLASHLYEKSADDPRLFPFSAVTARVIWNNALERAKFEEQDEPTSRHRIHPHVLRKFVRTRLGSVIPVDVVEALMGHEGCLTEVYRTYTVEDLAGFYNRENMRCSYSRKAEKSPSCVRKCCSRGTGFRLL